MRDALTEAINSPEGRLAEAVVRRLTTGKAKAGVETLQRLDRLITEPGRAGFLARICLAAEVSTLFEYAPEWTTARLVPLFDWRNAEAGEAWSARKYASYIGSPKLFALTKSAFLDMFGRDDVPIENLNVYSDWLIAILLANQRGGDGYSLAASEARAALRRAGAKVLAPVGHRLAIEMEQAKPHEKWGKWSTLVGPVFEGVWPLDIELQSPATTFKLVQLLLATGDAFGEAARVIIPFIRPEDRRGHTSVYSISEAPEDLYALSPPEMLKLLGAVVGDQPPSSVPCLAPALEKLRRVAPDLSESVAFQKLLASAAD